MLGLNELSQRTIFRRTSPYCLYLINPLSCIFLQKVIFFVVPYLIVFKPFISLIMNQQISPWSIYDHIQHPSKNAAFSKQKVKFSKKMSSIFQQSALSTKPEDQGSQKCTQANHLLSDQLDKLLLLRIIHTKLKQEDKDVFFLPEIKHHPVLKECMQMGRGFQSGPRSKSTKKPFTYEEDLQELSGYRSQLTVLNLQPFDQQDIIRRGLIQLLKIQQRKRRAKKVSKANNK